MPDIGFMELFVIGIVALIVVGPKDLPIMFRKAGQFMGNVRGMARQFTRAMEDAASEAGVKDISRDLRNLTNPKKMGMDAINKAFDDIDPTKFPEGSETRRLAEEKAAAQKVARETAAANRAAELERIRSAKIASANPPVAEAAAVTPAVAEPVASAEPPASPAAVAPSDADTGAERT